MTRKILFFVLTITLSFAANAQSKKTMGGPTRPEHKWEAGVGLGHLMANSDVKFKPGFGATVHLRRAVDHIFSIRATGQFGSLSFKDDVDRSDYFKNRTRLTTTKTADIKSTYMSGVIEGVMSLNNFDFTRMSKKWDPYVAAGIGGALYTPKSGSSEVLNDKPGFNPLARFAFGISYKISPKINITLEQAADLLFGKNSDLVDGVDYYNASDRTLNNDVPLYTNVRLNFNIGKKTAVEPLYWTNPMGQIQSDIAELKARPKFDPTDTDADGVIDMFDQEKNTPAGYAVDTRGVTLDSDSDGVANAKDKEPFSPPGYKVNADGVANVPKPDFTTEADVIRIVDGKLADIKASLNKPGLSDWFLPMINYDFNKSNVKQSEFEKLAYVANVMQRNASVKVVVTGYTDAVSGPSYNDNLSYNRSEAAINYLVNKYSIDRSRFILNYSGENAKLVDTNAKNYINRRVEFKVATGKESEMARPAGATMSTKKTTKFKGNKEAGY
jgi:outer membrane protein OmpA-like peptidoglycan-associated protein